MASLVSPRRNPAACALLSGLLLILCFPAAQFSLLAFAALAPLLATLAFRRRRWRVFLLGYLTGVVFFAGTGSWVYGVMRIYGHLSVAAAGAVLALFVLSFALFFGAFALAVGEVARRWQFGALWAAPFFWVALEWLRTYVPFGGFPWNLLGYAVAPHIGWVQPAAYVGVYGISFLLVAINALVAAYWLAPAPRRAYALLAVAVALAGTEVWSWRLPPARTSTHVLLVQPNLPQERTFDPDWVQHHQDEVARLIADTRAAARSLPPGSLVVWPEVPVSFYFHYDPVLRGELLHLTQAMRSYFVVGIIDYRPDGAGKQQPYNSAVLLSPNGEFIGQYDKIHLVPFGEYLPLRRWLGALGPLVEEVSAFAPGRRVAVLPAGASRLGIFICYEAIFPALVRDFAERGATVLVNLSNDGWFGRSAAAAQHLNMARLRAVETRRFLLRATNSGFTAVIDPYGRVVAEAPQGTRATLEAGFTPRHEESSYVRHGDWFAALCTLVALGALARRFWVLAVEGGDDGTD